ncbi:hypothetical protein P3X46_019239 [Hevea brasiliensis]|uniref:Peptidase A1 domain-containing protein n=1 Tax=Hevea brasiliensis TaxID=3981 RepID=A0ABQ9LK29_HEVBR|nr:aspartyl protease AED1 [Hevea brasiliensis]KAJ9167622.1 hypothetical protein P3X46_019239 [Hevea brasiliensis]
MAQSHHLSAICPFLFYSALFLSCVYGARELAEINPLLPPASPCFTSAKGQFQGLQIVNKYEPCSSPLSLEKSRPNQEVLLQDQFRARLLDSLEVVDEYGEGIQLPLTSRGDGNFLVTVGVGTPKRDFTLLFDTGSDATWIQCEPCSAGCNHQIPIFYPSSSSSFSNAICNITCDYSMNYHDGTYSSGYYVVDTLTIQSDLHPNFIFGCAQKIHGDFGGAVGLLGVGPGNLSLVAQTDTGYFRVFCYCLPASENSAGYLSFGVQAFENCQPDENKLIPISLGLNQNAYSYFVTLTGITIGQQRLDISGNVSSPLKAIIDSGTSISRLPFSLYSALRQAFRRLMSQYPTASPSQNFDTCYNLEGQNNWTPPKMVLHFEGVDLDLDPSAVTFREKDNNAQVCLAFMANENDSDLTIIGNQQHREMNVFFDISNQKLAFTSGGCSNW